MIVGVSDGQIEMVTRHSFNSVIYKLMTAYNGKEQLLRGKIATFTYDAFGQRTVEQVSGLYSKTLTLHWDAFGRNVGYSVDGYRKQSITYDSATGRIAESDGFAWDYLAGSNLKSSLTYPNEAVVTWTYEPHRDLLTAVTNATYSTYVYTNDLLGRRTSKNDEQYGYNVRDELISADEVSYNYDDIGNRTTAEGKTYTANNLNQYTAIDDFTPQYDADGNQTLIKTETGIWSVTYNAENRPIRWQSGDTVITMAFDRMGRRVEMRTVKDGVETLQRFVYDNYLCIQQLRGADKALYQSYVWDPTEKRATRPLIFHDMQYLEPLFYLFDGDKNIVGLLANTGTVITYDYDRWGQRRVQGPTQKQTTQNFTIENPFGFMSEWQDIRLGTIHYNYRDYCAKTGRWLQRDPIATKNRYHWSPTEYDFLGLATKEQMQQLLGLFTRCSTDTSVNSSPRLREKYQKATGVLMEKMLGRNYKKYSGKLLDAAKSAVNQSEELIKKLENDLDDENDEENRKELENVLGQAEDILDALSAINAASGDVSAQDTATVLNYFVGLASKGLPAGMKSYFGYLTEGINVSLKIVEGIDSTFTENVLSVIRRPKGGGECPCDEAKDFLSGLTGDLREIGRIFNAN